MTSRGRGKKATFVMIGRVRKEKRTVKNAVESIYIPNIIKTVSNVHTQYKIAWGKRENRSSIVRKRKLDLYTF